MSRRSRKRGALTPPAADPQDLLGRWRIGIEPQLLTTALTHRSYAFEVEGATHNERLEYLGDSVLSIIVTDYLYHHFPYASEAQLSRMRGAIVSEKTLAKVARTLELGDFIRLGRGENLSGGRQRESILSDTVESLIAATYLSHGLDTTRSIVQVHLQPYLDQAVDLGRSADYKTTLQEYCAELSLGEPIYADLGYGPDHARAFIATVTVGTVVVGAGHASSKKHARGAAAEVAYLGLKAHDGNLTAAQIPDPLIDEDARAALINSTHTDEDH